MAEANSDIDPIPYDADTLELEDVDDEMDQKNETNFMVDIEVLDALYPVELDSI